MSPIFISPLPLLLIDLSRLEDNLVLVSVGFDTSDGFRASKLYSPEDERKTRAAERRAKFLQLELSQEGPHSCSPPPSPALPAPGSGSFQDSRLFEDDDDWVDEKPTPAGGGIKDRVQLLEKNLKTPISRSDGSTQHDRHTRARQAAAARPGEPEESHTNYHPARGPGYVSPQGQILANQSRGRQTVPLSPDRLVVPEKEEQLLLAKEKSKGSFFSRTFRNKSTQYLESRKDTMAGVPPPPTSGVDMALMAELLQSASEESQLQNANADDAWKGILGGVSVKIYAPQSSRNIRQTCGVSWASLSESFLDTANTVAVGQRRLGTVKKRGVFSKEEDQILLAPGGPYVAKTISAQECNYLARVASRYVEHFADCQNSLLPRFYAIIRISKGGKIKSTEHWVVTDNLNDLPLPVRLTYDLKGVSSRNTRVAGGNEPLVVLKEGNLPLSNNVQGLPQVSLALSLLCVRVRRVVCAPNEVYLKGPVWARGGEERGRAAAYATTHYFGRSQLMRTKDC